jgi:hypothetical protein
MLFSELPSDLYFHLIEYMELSDVISFCSTSNNMLNHCNTKEIINELKTKINTTYNLNNLTLKQLILFGKTNLLRRKIAIQGDTALYIHNSKFVIYDLNTGHKGDFLTLFNIKLGNLHIDDIHQIAILKILPSLHSILVTILTNDGEIYSLISNQNPNLINNKKYISIRNDVDNKEGLYTITVNGECSQNTRLFNFTRIDFKNVVQVAGDFILDIYGDVYIKLVNGNIYNPIDQNYINYNKYFSFSLFTKTQYHKVFSNVKQIHTLGYFLSKAEIYKFDWYSMEVEKLPYKNVDQFECYLKYNKEYEVLVFWLSEGKVYIRDDYLSVTSEYVYEIHTSHNKLIYYDDINIISADMDSLIAIVTPV